MLCYASVPPISVLDGQSFAQNARLFLYKWPFTFPPLSRCPPGTLDAYRGTLGLDLIFGLFKIVAQSMLSENEHRCRSQEKIVDHMHVETYGAEFGDLYARF